MRRLALSLAALAVCAGPALAQGEFAHAPAAPVQANGFAPPRPQKPEHTTPPISVRLSASKGAGYVAEKVCLPGLFGGNPPATLAPYYQMNGADITDAGGHAGDNAWYLASTTKVYAIAFADGACGVSVGNGSPGDYRTAVVDALKTAAKPFAAGAVKVDAQTHLTTSTFCTAGDRPAVARIAVATLGFHTPHYLEASFFTAPSGRPADCTPDMPQK